MSRCVMFFDAVAFRRGGNSDGISIGSVTSVLNGEYIGFEEVSDGLWDVYFGPMRIGRFHERLLRIEDSMSKLKRRV